MRESNNRITIVSNGQTTVLADWTDTVQDEDISAPGVVQPVKYLRGNSAAFARGNDLVTLSFVVCREWSSLKLAWDAWINARNRIPSSGDLAWLTRDGNLSRYLPSCVLQVKPVRRLGTANYFQYVCTGPEITTTPPAKAAS